jgi:hypothetical protein
MSVIKYPSLYQINTRVRLTELSRALGRSATLDDIRDPELAQLAEQGFDWIWFLSVWRTGEAGQQVSRQNQQWRQEFAETLPDLQGKDIAGSGFAITGYEVHPNMGGDAALARLRKRLAQRGLKLMLDFVPNHTGLDHPWVTEHPEYYIHGSPFDVIREPMNYTMIKRKRKDLIMAYGRDPYFAGWPDTLQLNYGNPATQQAMRGELLKIAGQCDGVRCDMAMLVLPDIFERTWEIRSQAFWPDAIQSVRERFTDFCFMAEVYWDLEWTLQQQGFDNTYDKRLYDRLREGHARPVREHLHATLDYQTKLARFLENHDEPRAATIFDPPNHRAAAVITYFIPGLRFFHQGQFEGHRKRISPHLVRAPEEATDTALVEFYRQLLAILRKPALKSGEWQCLTCRPAWDGNGSWDAFIAHSWQGTAEERMLIVINYAAHHSQCYVNIPFPEIKDRSVQLYDLLGDTCYTREGNNLLAHGLYLDLPAWSYHVFEMEIE